MYIARLHQPGGCDYTIECGTRVIPLKATTREDAVDELFRIVVGAEEDHPAYAAVEGGYMWRKPRIDEVTLYEVVSTETMPLDDWYAIREEEMRQVAAAYEQAKKRRLYEDLKRQFG